MTEAITTYQYRAWTAVEASHPLAALDERELAGGRLRVRLGPRSRFGARYFAALLETAAGELSAEPVVTGLHNSGPLPAYNWIEVAETRTSVQLPGAGRSELTDTDTVRLFGYLYDVIPSGGHLMVEYDSAARAETARGLARGVPPVATPLGDLLYRVGFGAYFKDWQIAEGGSEGPRKLQAYRPPTDADAARWRAVALKQLDALRERTDLESDLMQAALARADALLPLLRGDADA